MSKGEIRVATSLRAQDRVGLTMRAVLVVAASILGLVNLPIAPRTVVVALAVAVVAERTARLRRRGLVDAVLVGVGGLLVTAALVGLVLNYLPGHLGQTSWAAALSVVGLSALVFCATRPWSPSPLLVLRRQPSLITATTVFAAVFVLGAAVVLSVRSFNNTTVDPLQLAAPGEVQDGRAQVVLTSAERVGPLDLVAVNGEKTIVIASAITLAAGGSLTEAVPVPAGSRVLVQLRYPGQSTALRSLILDGPVTP